MNEVSARRVLLVQAIETADTEGRLVSEVERELIDHQARQSAQASAGAGPVPAEEFVDLRAQRVLAVVGERDRAIAALRDRSTWGGGLMAGVVLSTVLLGAFTERIADPHRVDLLSLPLLAIILWNVLVYLFMLAGLVVPRRKGEKPAFDALRRWAEGSGRGRRGGRLVADVTVKFQAAWGAASASMQAQRWRALLHLAALGWAVGVGVSLLVQGLVVEYRVGWESTFLAAAQVHAILSVLLTPVIWLFPFEPFSVAQIARLQLGPGGVGQADPRWVWMYVALLLVVVVVPRAILALLALARARLLARNIAIDVQAPYFQRIVSLLHPAQVRLCVVTHRHEDRAALLAVLVQESERQAQLISSPSGDALLYTELPGAMAPPRAAQPAAAGWFERLRRRLGRPRAAPVSESGGPRLDSVREQCHVVLHVVGAAADLETASALLRWLDKPVLVLVNRPESAEPEAPGLVARCQSRAHAFAPVAGVLSFDEFARCWVQEGVLLEAIRGAVPAAMAPGFDRIAQAWHMRNRARFGRSMRAIAEHLLFAARQVEEVPASALSVKSLVVAGERQAQSLARQGAMHAVAEKLGRSAADMFAKLRELHGIDSAMADELEEGLEEKFMVRQPVDAPQAAMAGAAGGAATGASVDLLTGGLTLGAATALGALVGASAAFIGAAWKNRATPAGASVIQLSDEMMQALVEAALLRYLAVAHHGRAAGGADSAIRPFWKADVVAAVQAHGSWLAPFWAAARAHTDPEHEAALAGELETIAMRVLDTLYPSARGPR